MSAENENKNAEEVEEVATEETVAEPRDPAFGGEADSPDFKWYIARALTGQETKIAKSLKERIVNYQKSEFFADIMIPEETVVSNAGGKKRTLKKKFFPGYILIKMMMTDDTWRLVKDTDKITGFVGGSSMTPSPITEQEAAYMLGQAQEGVKKAKTTVSFSEGEQVKVIEGPFASFVGTVEAINDKGKVKVNVSIFGRPTPVELDFSQVERVS